MAWLEAPSYRLKVAQRVFPCCFRDHAGLLRLAQRLCTEIELQFSSLLMNSIQIQNSKL